MLEGRAYDSRSVGGSSTSARRHRLPWAPLAAALVAGASVACSYGNIAVRTIGNKARHSLEATARASPENNVLVTGLLLRARGALHRPVYVVALSPEDDELRVVSATSAGTGGTFSFLLAPATYQFVALTDLDGDGSLTSGVDDAPNEVVGVAPGPVAVHRTQGNGGLVASLRLPVEQQALEEVSFGFDDAKNVDVDLDANDLSARPSPVVFSLDAEQFDDRHAKMGMLSPIEFTQSVGPVHFLDPPDFSGEKVPVIYVHGISGSPRDFSRLVDNLDRERYQPWFFFYPSGARLDTSAHLLYEYFFSGNYLPRMPRVVVTAHSMGGLVARGALNLLTRSLERNPDGTRKRSPVVLYVSFVSPYGGVESASTGASRSPVRVASWIDVAAGSEYVEALSRTPLPKETPFALFCGCAQSDGDGTIKLESQLEPKIRKEARWVLPYEATHEGILRVHHVSNTYNHLLDVAAFPRMTPAPKPAPKGRGCNLEP